MALRMAMHSRAISRSVCVDKASAWVGNDVTTQTVQVLHSPGEVIDSHPHENRDERLQIRRQGVDAVERGVAATDAVVAVDVLQHHHAHVVLLLAPLALDLLPVVQVVEVQVGQVQVDAGELADDVGISGAGRQARAKRTWGVGGRHDVVVNVDILLNEVGLTVVCLAAVVLSLVIGHCDGDAKDVSRVSGGIKKYKW
ncbi:hypothetical protein GE09DRAFT_71919 [Coniochaeta sp. 2T2.1]|nr:hypothetical protein GE09DRAFT_71919 [Coniochaeta sp. 2T2.1]